MNDLLIIGGGITGLAAAWLAAKKGRTVEVLEASDQFGGLLQTFEIAGSRLEFFYHHFFTHDTEIHAFLKALEIDDRIIYRSSTMGVYRDGQNWPFDGPKDLLGFKPMSLPAKVRFALTSLYLGKVADWRKLDEVSCYEWFRKNAGGSATEAIWGPMLEVKFGPYAKDVPLSWMVGRLRQRMGSRQGGEERLGYIDGSLQVLLEALLAQLKDLGVTLTANAKVRRLEVADGRIQKVHTDDASYEGKQVLYTAPTLFLGDQLDAAVAANPGLSDWQAAIRRMEYFGALCVILQTKKPLSETYWLNIADPGFPFGGVIEQTNLVPPSHYQDTSITYLSRYFAHGDPLEEMSDEQVQIDFLQALRRVYPDLDQKEILDCKVFRTRTAAPVCDLGFAWRLPRCQTPVEGFYLASMPHLFPDERSVNNSIRLALEALTVMGQPEVGDLIPRGRSLSGAVAMS